MKYAECHNKVCYIDGISGNWISLRECSNVFWYSGKAFLRLDIFLVVVVILFPTQYKQWRTEYMSNITTTMKA